jgi:RHS repeat-associated protein
VRTFGSDGTTFGFAGQRVHSESGLALTLHRAYDASVGRWLSEDPIGIEDGPNMYAYVSNKPTVWVDPLGLEKCCAELEKRRQRLHQILNQLEAGQEPTGVIGGMTVCAGNVPDPLDTEFIRRQMGPCLAGCAIAHERRHAQQCRRFGNLASYASSSSAHERSAYLVELGCVIQKLRSLKCEDCK